MKKYINKLIVFCALIFLSTSCQNDALLTTLKTVSFSGLPQASPSTIILSTSTTNQPVVTISWPAVVYPVQAPVTYALQFDVPSDIVGSTAWGNSIRIAVGEDVLSKSLLGADLNKIAIQLGLPLDVVGEIVVRVESNLDRTSYSEPITLSVTPFSKPVVFTALYMPGSYQGVPDVTTAAQLDPISKGVYQCYITFPASQGLGYKLTTQRNMNQFYGAGTNGIVVDGSTTDFAVPAAGSYQITVDLNTSSIVALPYSWGIIGDATPGGWNSSSPMTYNYQQKIWTWTGPLLAKALKFRLNDNWNVNYGPQNQTDGIMYHDIPAAPQPGAYNVPAAGNYTVTFKINDIDPANNGFPISSTYTVTKN